MINLQNVVNFPSQRDNSWPVHIQPFSSPLVLLHAGAYEHVPVCACMLANICVGVYQPLFNYLHDGLIGLAAKGPKASAA